MREYSEKLLMLLKEDARMSTAEIASTLGIGEQEVIDAIDELLADGTIVKFCAIVNGEKVRQDHVTAWIEIKVTPQKDKGFDQIAAEIAAYDEVKNLYLMSGGYDLGVMVEGDTLREISNLVHERLAVIDNVTATATHFMLKCYKSSGVILDGELTEKRLPVQP